LKLGIHLNQTKAKPKFEGKKSLKKSLKKSQINLKKIFKKNHLLSFTLKFQAEHYSIQACSVISVGKEMR